MLRKRELAYLAEDYNLNYDDFVKYCFANYPDRVWSVFDGIKYCYADSAEFLVNEYVKFKELVKEFNYAI